MSTIGQKIIDATRHEKQPKNDKRDINETLDLGDLKARDDYNLDLGSGDDIFFFDADHQADGSISKFVDMGSTGGGFDQVHFASERSDYRYLNDKNEWVEITDEALADAISGSREITIKYVGADGSVDGAQVKFRNAEEFNFADEPDKGSENINDHINLRTLSNRDDYNIDLGSGNDKFTFGSRFDQDGSIRKFVDMGSTGGGHDVARFAHAQDHYLYLNDRNEWVEITDEALADAISGSREITIKYVGPDGDIDGAEVKIRNAEEFKFEVGRLQASFDGYGATHKGGDKGSDAVIGVDEDGKDDGVTTVTVDYADRGNILYATQLDGIQVDDGETLKVNLGGGKDAFNFGNALNYQARNGTGESYIVDGGAGRDTVYLRGTIEDYALEVDGDNVTLTLRDENGDATGPSITFTDFERFVFKNKVGGENFKNDTFTLSQVKQAYEFLTNGGEELVENQGDIDQAAAELAAANAGMTVEEYIKSIEGDADGDLSVDLMVQ